MVKKTSVILFDVSPWLEAVRAAQEAKCRAAAAALGGVNTVDDTLSEADDVAAMRISAPGWEHFVVDGAARTFETRPPPIVLLELHAWRVRRAVRRCRLNTSG